MKGERLEGGAYREIPEAADGSVRSEVLGLDLRVKRREREPEWRELRFRHPETGEDLPSHEEEHANRIEATRQARSEAGGRRRAERRAEAAERRAKAEAAASRELKRRIAELEAKLARRG